MLSNMKMDTRDALSVGNILSWKIFGVHVAIPDYESGQDQRGTLETRCLKQSEIIEWWKKLVHEYRDKTYIRKDILIMLTERGELNQTPERKRL